MIVSFLLFLFFVSFCLSLSNNESCTSQKTEQVCRMARLVTYRWSPGPTHTQQARRRFWLARCCVLVFSSFSVHYITVHRGAVCQHTLYTRTKNLHNCSMFNTVFWFHCLARSQNCTLLWLAVVYTVITTDSSDQSLVKTLDNAYSCGMISKQNHNGVIQLWYFFIVDNEP